MTSAVPQIKSVRPTGGYRLAIEFTDGAFGEHDLAWALERAGPMNDPLRDPDFFSRVFVEAGALTWPNGFDLSPWNIRKRMEDTGEIQLTSTNKGGAADEATDLARVTKWFEARGVDAKRVKQGRREKTKAPDLQLFRDGRLVGWCEVKSRRPGDWRRLYEDDQLYAVGDRGKDPTLNSLAEYVMAAHDQLMAVDRSHETCWVVAIVNHDSAVDVFDFRETLTGDFYATDGNRYATMKGVSEGVPKSVKFEIDLYLWFELNETIPIVGEADFNRAEGTRKLFGLTGPRILWST